MIRIPHLETDVTTACQLSCVACNHSVPLWRKVGPMHAKPAQVEKDLFHLATLLHADRWGALGGEPLLSKSLIDILRIARASQVADKTEVWTNGLALRNQRPEFWRSFDVLVLSVYEGKLTDDQIAWIVARCTDEGIELVVKDERVWKNFKTMLEPTPTGFKETQEKFRHCFFKSFSRVADNGYFFTCCCAPHLPSLMQMRPFGTDGIPIEGLTEKALDAYLRRNDALGCCDICAGRDTAKPIEWREERDPVKWIAASAGG